MQVIRNKNAILLALLVFAAAPAHAQVARVLEVKGTTLVERAGQPPRILGANDLLDAQQVVTVARDSHAVIEFSDKTRVTLRPGTIFRVDDYRQGSPESYLRGLLKGGARIIGNSTAHSAEFDARLCEKDCAEEDRLRPEPHGLGNPVARVVEMKGTVAAARSGEHARVLVPGTAIYERDGVATGAGSYAVLVFSDDSRITLAENSRLAVNRFEYRETVPREGKAYLTLLAGNAQVWGGRLAEIGADAFQFESAMGVIRSVAPGHREATHE